MFCSRCGQQIPDDSTFCSSCGNQVCAASDYQPLVNDDYEEQMQRELQMQKNVMRQNEMQKLDAAIQYFLIKKSVYDEYDIAAKRMNYYKRGAKSGLIVWGAILMFFGLITCFAVAGSGESAMPFFLAILLPALLMLTGGILMKVNNRVKLKRYIKRFAETYAELYNHATQYPECPVPLQYSNPDILEAVMLVLNADRADTIGDALNLLMQEGVDDRYRMFLDRINAKSNAVSFYSVKLLK